MFPNQEGENVPQVTFTLCQESSTRAISTADIFLHKTVVVFAVPGAFTYPYSTVQLLGYNSYAKAFKANGVDRIVCIAVNNSFVLSQWAKTQQAHHICFIPDADGEFTRKMGMLVSFSDKGMGQRSWRYSMLVKNMVIEKMFVERVKMEEWPTVSNAETMLNYINPSASKPQEAVVLMQMWRALLYA